jgi:Type IV secretion-system coupling protein DNA-binding domain
MLSLSIVIPALGTTERTCSRSKNAYLVISFREHRLNIGPQSSSYGRANREADSEMKGIVATAWEKICCIGGRRPNSQTLQLGWKVLDGATTRVPLFIPGTRRAEHIVILGKSGSGKSSFLRSLASQDIVARRGFVFFDVHGDATAHLLRRMALEESRSHEDLSDRVIVIDPADPTWSTGINVLGAAEGTDTFVQIAEFTDLLKRRWRLESLGARTEEALRNSLVVLAQNGFTILELAPLLVDARFRRNCLRNTANDEARRYFESRYDARSDAMQAVVREAILNKTSLLSADWHFRHLLGQAKSTFSLRSAMDGGRWIVLNLDKGRLGEQAITFGSLFLAMIKNALFSRGRRDLYTLYCDEVQNLVAYDSGVDTLLSEARKFGVSVVSANQFLDQYPPKIRAAILGAGTQVFFRLTAADAREASAALGGGSALCELLKNLPNRHMIVKSG